MSPYYEPPNLFSGFLLEQAYEAIIETSKQPT